MKTQTTCLVHERKRKQAFSLLDILFSLPQIKWWQWRGLNLFLSTTAGKSFQQISQNDICSIMTISRMRKKDKDSLNHITSSSMSCVIRLCGCYCINMIFNGKNNSSQPLYFCWLLKGEAEIKRLHL